MKAVAAMSLNRVIGRNGRIPWRLPADLAFFKRLTTGHVVVMGRKTYSSLGKPLPRRENIVITRGGPIAGVLTVDSPERIPRPDGDREIFVIGGAQIYEALLPRCEELILTVVRQVVEGDAFFPPFEHLFEPREVLLAGEEFEIRRHVRR